MLKKEAAYFGDIIILPFMDRYELVVLKTIAICEFGVSQTFLCVVFINCTSFRCFSFIFFSLIFFTLDYIVLLRVEFEF